VMRSLARQVPATSWRGGTFLIPLSSLS
jgi:hypothetical protein